MSEAVLETIPRSSLDNSRLEGRRVRVLHVVEAMELGGMERMIAALTQASDRERFDVQVLCLKAVGVVGASLAQSGFAVHDAGFGRETASYFPFRRLAETIRAIGPDVVHTHNMSALLSGAFSARLAGVRHVVHTEHGRKFPDQFKYMLAERAASMAVRHVVGVSQSVTHDLRRFEWIPARKLHVIANGVLPIQPVPESHRLAVRTALGIAPTAPVVGATGRLVWEKGLDELLQAWTVVHASRPEAMLLIVGDGPLRGELHTLASTLGIEKRVVFAGAREDVAVLLQTMDVFVMPSVSEGLPLALLEAMSVGLPIVATDVGGMPDALDHGEGGIIVPPRDREALARGILQLLNSANDAARFSVVAQRRFHERFTASAMARAYERLYQDATP